MRKPITAALLLGGHILLTFSPVAALAAPSTPAAGAVATGSYRAFHYGCHYDCRDPYDHGDSHYRCMYHCDERYRYGYGYDDYRYRRYRDNRVYHDGECWAHDDRGWHRCGYRDRGWE
jgi:hypothetical protein